MSANYDDEVQIEMLRRWWHENWKPLVFGVVIGLAAIIGWQRWHAHRAAHEADGSRMFGELQQAVQAGKDDQVDQLAATLIKNYADTPYAGGSQLLLAALAVGQGRYDDARSRLQWVVKNGIDAGTRALAKLRLAQVLWQLNQPDDALVQLSGLPAPFAALADQLRGDILADQGRREQAYRAYHKALDQLPADSSDRDTLTRKLDDLADAGNPSSAPAKPAAAASSRQ
ncbi:MAG: tetratricopeptide repeat protein [Gammaproteobacteria bacterium]|nr:tetratricopeptide repeat protein [Gammaproteobacteria bacterium]